MGVLVITCVMGMPVTMRAAAVGVNMLMRLVTDMNIGRIRITCWTGRDQPYFEVRYLFSSHPALHKTLLALSHS